MKNQFNVLNQLLGLALISAVVLVVGCSQDIDLKQKELGSIKNSKNASVVKDDFDFPSESPKLSNGKVVFSNNCKTCHSPGTLSYNKIKDVRPVDQYLILSRGEGGTHNVKGHPVFRQLTRQQKWEAVFYYRFLAGGSSTTVPKKARNPKTGP